MTWTFLKNLRSSPKPHMMLFGRTDTGRTRPNNEDSFIIMPKSRMMMVADGMGGHNAGEVASRAAIESMARLVESQATLTKTGTSQEEIRHLLIRNLRETNRQIMQLADENQAYSGMGCTFIIAYINRGCLHTCHVGDVRAYLLNTQGLTQLTNDHTYVAEFTKTSEAHHDPACLHPKVNRHVVSRAIGFPFPEDPECTSNPVAKGDRLLLCSDGLWSMLADPQLNMILQEAATPEEACDRLIAEANQAGGRDNITAVVGFV